MMWNKTLELNILHPIKWINSTEKLLENYADQIYYAGRCLGWDCPERQQGPQWSFAGSMLYSVTVITTIGYGHITPKTEEGQLMTLIYAIFGIPLTLLTVTHLGGFMATSFRFFYKTLSRLLGSLCRYLCAKLAPNRLLCRLCCHGGTTHQNNEEEDSFLREELSNRRKQIGWRARPLCCSDVTSDREQQEAQNFCVRLQEGLQSACKDLDDVRVPAYVIILVIFAYIAIGAHMFSTWENWTFLIGCYFCFITLSTIGFGDYVPGSKEDSWATQKLVVCALYLLIGLALIAMCFDLIQEEVRQTIKAIARRMGLASKPEND